MNVRLFKTLAGTARYVVLCAFAAGIFCWHSQCQAQPSAQPSAAFDDPLKQINWITGPQTRSLGNIADITVPEGYRLTDAHGARFILDTLNTPVPDDVVGVLASDSSKSVIVLEYSPKGYVKGADTAQINPKSVLKAVQKQAQTQDNGQAVPSMTWGSAPVYSSQTHSLAWSIQAQTPSSKTLNDGEVLLGRHGYIELTAVDSYPASAALELKQIAANITFKAGERYTDFKNGDNIAEIGLAGVITGEKQGSAAGIFSSAFGGAAAAWAYGGLVLLMLGGLFVLRKKSQRRSAHAHAHRAHVPAAASAALPVAAAATVSAAAPSPVLKNGELNGHSQPAMATAERNGSKTNRHRRKRVFDYSKFYTNAVKELSLHSYGTGSVLMNGKSNGYANGRHNGHVNGNGHTNGHANGHVNGNGANGHAGANDSVKTEIEQLIATQKRLIEEQKCLLEQQTKLIEEKRWLIQEQSAFLKGQANLIEDQQFPLKFQ